MVNQRMQYTSQVISYATARSEHVQSAGSFRMPTDGPEFDIVREYCERQLQHVTAEEALTIFVEPNVAGSFPDLVAVVWNPEIASKWPAARGELLASDSIFLHYLNVTGSLPLGYVVKRVGLRKANETVERLSDAGVVHCRRGELRSKPLKEIFAVERLIAIEAKVKDWRKGLEQAFQNSWFASETYLLLGVLPQNEELSARAKALGVGLISREQPLATPEVRARKDRLPLSNASWLFNEWAWKHSPM